MLGYFPQTSKQLLPFDTIPESRVEHPKPARKPLRQFLFTLKTHYHRLVLLVRKHRLELHGMLDAFHPRRHPLGERQEGGLLLGGSSPTPPGHEDTAHRIRGSKAELGL